MKPKATEPPDLQEFALRVVPHDLCITYMNDPERYVRAAFNHLRMRLKHAELEIRDLRIVRDTLADALEREIEGRRKE